MTWNYVYYDGIPVPKNYLGNKPKLNAYLQGFRFNGGRAKTLGERGNEIENAQALGSAVSEGLKNHSVKIRVIDKENGIIRLLRKEENITFNSNSQVPDLCSIFAGERRNPGFISDQDWEALTD